MIAAGKVMTVAQACDLDQWIVQRSQLVRGRPFRKSSYNLILATIDSKHEIPPQPGSVAQRYTSWYRRACLGGVTRKKEFSLGNLEAGGEGGIRTLLWYLQSVSYRFYNPSHPPKTLKAEIACTVPCTVRVSGFPLFYGGG